MPGTPSYQENHPHIRNIVDRSNWTHQNSFSDGLGHGSFVAGEVERLKSLTVADHGHDLLVPCSSAGVIGSQDSGCPGFAPDVELYTFKVFTDDQVRDSTAHALNPSHSNPSKPGNSYACLLALFVSMTDRAPVTLPSWLSHFDT